jgi:hypothetical protein
MSHNEGATGLSRGFKAAVIAIFMAIVVSALLCVRFTEERHIGAICQVILLGVAAAVPAWYADETWRMADAAQVTVAGARGASSLRRRSRSSETNQASGSASQEGGSLHCSRRVHSGNRRGHCVATTH